MTKYTFPAACHLITTFLQVVVDGYILFSSSNSDQSMVTGAAVSAMSDNIAQDPVGLLLHLWMY